MKNRKNMFVLAIVALILVLGVGYAVVSQTTLTITGSGTAKTETLKVVYDGVNSGTTNGATGKVTSITNPDGTTAATFEITDMALNETVSMSFEIENRESDVNATINFPTITQNTKSDYFSVAFEYKDSAISGSGTQAAWASGTKTLAHGAKATIVVKVTMTNTPITSTDSSTNITISFTADPVAAA